MTDETRHIIGRDQVAMMKDGAIVVNTSRRDVVDESALSEALRDGKLYGVGIDVPKTCEEQAEELSESVRRHVAGEPPRFLVTP